jgi:uncharacterized membrane protein
VVAIDAARGGVMLIMALDHVRDFIHRGAMVSSPTDLTQTTVTLFLTRWITHVCAPTFIFTAGLGAYFWGRGGHTRAELTRFLVSRGSWFVLLELTLMRVAYNFSWLSPYPVLLIVLWVIGACMIVMGLCIWLPRGILASLALATIALHNLLDSITAAQSGTLAPLWTVLHQVGTIRLFGLVFIVAYPLIPWVAVMALGFAAGPIFERDPASRQRVLMVMGIATCIGFVLLRAVNGYGDPAPWSSQPSAAFTLLSFLDASKYPPSLIFLLMTLGPALVALASLDRAQLAVSNPLVVFGRAPLFYFVAHFFLAHVAAVALAFVRYGATTWTFAFHPVPSMGGPRTLYPPDFGDDLGVAYVVWFVIVLALYPACRAVAAWKARREQWWVSYL